MFDAEGNINACNRSAEALFGHDGPEWQLNLADLLAPESQHAVFEYLAGVKSAGPVSVLEHGREMLGRVRKGGVIPLSVTIGRTRADGRTSSPCSATSRRAARARTNWRRPAAHRARRQRQVRHAGAHQPRDRAPLNAIIGFAEVMIGERFGALGNERYGEYMKDIRASG